MNKGRWVIILLLGVSAGFAAERNVPSQYPTIQAAIDDANAADTVIVAPGRYYEHISFGGKAIAVRSSDPADWEIVKATIIDGNQPQQAGLNCCVAFINSEGSDSVLEGLTLTGGEGSEIPGPWYLQHDSSWRIGGGVVSIDSSPTIRHCYITGNGRVVGRWPSSVSEDDGTGIALLGNCEALVSNCVIVDNWGRSKGAAIFMRSINPDASQTVIENCTIAYNSMRFLAWSAQVDCGQTAPKITNTIIWGDAPCLVHSQPAMVTYCCVRDAYLTESDSRGANPKPYDLTVAGGNINTGPLFVKPPRYWHLIGEMDYHVLPQSACVNAGDPAYTGAGQRDMDGQARVMGGRLDIGADEIIEQIVVKRPSAGDVWSAGSRHNIVWKSMRWRPVDILFSRDGGVIWETIAQNEVDDGIYEWVLPERVVSEQCVVGVAPSVADANVLVVDSGLFTIQKYPKRPAVPLGHRRHRRLPGPDLTDNVGPEFGCVEWVFDTNGPVSSRVAIAGGEVGWNRIFAACEDGKLYALNHRGHLLWTYDANTPFVGSAAVGYFGMVYAGGENGVMYAIDENGKLRWTHRTDKPIFSTPVVSWDGQIYICSQDGRVYALGADGSELWTFRTSGFGSSPGAIFATPGLGGRREVYVAGLYDPNLYALGANDGSVKWACNFEFLIDPCEPNKGTEWGWPFASPTIGPDGTIYQTLLYDRYLYAIDANDGNILWTADLADPCSGWFEPNYSQDYGDADGWSQPAIGPDGTIYVSFDDPYLRAVTPEGDIKWVTRLGTVGGFTLTVGADGLIYAASDDGYVCAVNPAGEEIARFKGNGWLTFPVIAEDGTLIVSDSNNRVWAIGDRHCWHQQAVLHKKQDVDKDWRVGYSDLTSLATDWLAQPQAPCCGTHTGLYPPGDIDRNEHVNLKDFAILANKWMAGN